MQINKFRHFFILYSFLLDNLHDHDLSLRVAFFCTYITDIRTSVVFLNTCKYVFNTCFNGIRFQQENVFSKSMHLALFFAPLHDIRRP